MTRRRQRPSQRFTLSMLSLTRLLFLLLFSHLLTRLSSQRQLFLPAMYAVSLVIPTATSMPIHSRLQLKAMSFTRCHTTRTSTLRLLYLLAIQQAMMATRFSISRNTASLTSSPKPRATTLLSQKILRQTSRLSSSV